MRDDVGPGQPHTGEGLELVCLLQPIVNLRLDRAEAADAAACWQHPTDGLLAHGEAKPPEPRRVLDAICAAIVAPGPARDLAVAVHLTSSDLTSPVLASEVMRALEQHRLHPSALALVVPQTAAGAGVETARENLLALRRTGVAVHLSARGTGYSALSCLDRLPVDTIRIDGSIVGSVGTDRRADAIVAATTVTARTLRIRTLAEGVETTAQADALTALGIDQALGPLYGGHCSREGLDRWMAERTNRSRRRGAATAAAARRSQVLATLTQPAIDPEAAISRLAATRALLRVEEVEEAVGICIDLVRELGGWTIPARLDDGRALPLDCSFGHGEPLLPVAPAGLARLRLEQVLPEVLEDAREAIARIRQRDDLGREARTDPLTGLLNRRAVDRILSRMRPDDAVVIIDLDHFKSVNDTWGHAAGDAVLMAFSRTLRTTSRAGDHLARIGGEELLAALTGTDQDGVTRFLDRLQKAWVANRPRLVTYSAGVAWVGGRSAAETLAAADAALYAAKQRGRDRVEFAP